MYLKKLLLILVLGMGISAAFGQTYSVSTLHMCNALNTEVTSRTEMIAIINNPVTQGYKIYGHNVAAWLQGLKESLNEQLVSNGYKLYNFSNDELVWLYGQSRVVPLNGQHVVTRGFTTAGELVTLSGGRNAYAGEKAFAVDWVSAGTLTLYLTSLTCMNPIYLGSAAIDNGGQKPSFEEKKTTINNTTSSPDGSNVVNNYNYYSYTNTDATTKSEEKPAEEKTETTKVVSKVVYSTCNTCNSNNSNNSDVNQPRPNRGLWFAGGAVAGVVGTKVVEYFMDRNGNRQLVPAGGFPGGNNNGGNGGIRQNTPVPPQGGDWRAGTQW